MAYQLKSTGIAANCTMMIAVDPDTGTIKDFASASVTTDLLVGANVTVASQSWDGNTRHYFRNGAGSTDADFVKFGATKPNWSNNVNGTARTVVFIGEAAGAYVRVFGKDASHYFSGQSGSGGGNTLPYVIGCGWSASVDGGGTALTSGQKALFGYSSVHGTSATAYWALHDAASMSSSAETAPANTSTAHNFDLTYVGRRADSTGNNRDKIHAILIFNAALSEAQWDSLRDDWFGTLLESAGGGGDATATGGTLTATASLIAGSATGGGNATALGFTFTATASLIAGGASGVVNGVLTFQAAGLEFGARTGLGLDTFALDDGVDYRYTVHADGLTLGAALLTSAAITLDSAGKLPNLVSASLTPGTTYRVFAIRQSDGEAATFRLTAS